MTEVKIELCQIEESEIPLLRDFLNSKHAQNLGFYSAYSAEFLNQNFDMLWKDPNAYCFSIKTQHPGDFKKVVGGFCTIRNINWTARHGELLFIKINKDGNLLSIGECDEAGTAFKMLIDYCFDELNLNKVWIEIFQGYDVGATLDKLGFIAEGVRQFSRQVNAKQISTTIFSLLSEEYRR